MKRCWPALSLVFCVASSFSLADEPALKDEQELFPQSARVARDRRAETVLDSAKSLIAKQDFAGAIASLQTLLDGPNAFAAGASSGRSVHEEAQRLLAELPPTGRALYERVHGPEAERLWQAARRSGRPEKLRDVVARYGPTVAGWKALNDLANRHFDRGEWSFVASASESLARHSSASGGNDASWIVRWVLALNQVESTGVSGLRSAQDVLDRYRARLERQAAPQQVSAKSLAAWLDELLGTKLRSRTGVASRLPIDEPAAKETWLFSAGTDGEPVAWLNEILSEWKAYDVVAWPSVQPLSVGDLVIARFVHPSKVVAVDARQQRVIWERAATAQFGSTATDLQRHPGIRDALFDELQRRWFGDSVRGRMTTDGSRLFLVQDPEELDLKPGAGTRLRNHLECWDVATGARLWRVGTSNREPPTELQGVYFLGPPLVAGHTLYVVGQRESMIALWALRTDDGRVDWFVPLAESDRRRFQETDWRHVACPVTWSAGRLVCLTSAGCLVAVDPVTQSLAWSLRFERDDISTASGLIAADRDRPFPSRWWESWREVFLVESLGLTADAQAQATSTLNLQSSTLIVATPESRSLRGLDARTGEVRWRQAFDDPLFVTHHESAPLLVFQRHAVTAIDPQSGRALWTKSLPAAPQPGDWIGIEFAIETKTTAATTARSAPKYVCPLNDGGWAWIDTDTRNVVRSPAVGEPVLGRWLTVADRWVSLTPHTLRVFDSVSARLDTLTDRMRSKPDDVANHLELAKLARQRGDWKKSDELLRPLLDSKTSATEARTELRQTLLARLGQSPSEHSRLRADLLTLSPAESDQITAQHALIVAAHKSLDYVTALPAALELLAKNPADFVGVETNGSLGEKLHVRRDRWLQGLIENMFVQTDDVTRQQLREVLIERRQSAIDSPDPFALLQLARQLECLPIGRSIQLQLSGRTGLGVDYVRTSLTLRSIALGRDRAEAAQAWHRLALLHDFRSEPLEAADCYRELRDNFIDPKRPDIRTVTDWLADVMPDSAIGRALANGPSDPWPVQLPRVKPIDEPHSDVYCYLIPVESRDPFWRRITVSVERQGRKVRFHGAGQRGFWDAPLPASNSPYRHAHNLNRAWGFGPLLIVQVGVELFGIQPLDDRGETNAKVLWNVSQTDIEDYGGTDMRPGRLGVSSDDVQLLDRYEHPLLEVAHATPGLLCYRHRNRLIAIDPATGSRLWIRRQLPPRVTVAGDTEFVVIGFSQTNQRTREVRRAFDGKFVSSRIDNVEPNAIVMTHERMRLEFADAKSEFRNPNSESANSPLTPHPSPLICRDLVTNNTLWQLEVPRGSVPVRVDETRIGVLEPAGALRFLAWSDGRELAQHKVALPNVLSQVHVLGDDLRVFLLLAGPVTEQSWLATQQEGGFRKLLVSGSLLAFDRESLKPLWTIPTGNLLFALDQPRDLPFLLISYKRPSDDSADGNSFDGVLHAIDKRTGKEILYDVGGPNNTYFGLEPNPQDGYVDVLSTKRRIRLDYNAATTK